MRAIKRIFALSLTAVLLFISGCGNLAQTADSDSPVLFEGSLEKKTTYRLHIAEPQQVGRKMELTANPAYFLHKSIITDKEYLLKDLCVDRNDKVSAGDVVAVLQGMGSLMDAEQKRLEKNAYEANAAEMDAYYASMVAAAEAMPAATESEKELRRLSIEYAAAEYELYKLQSSYTIELMEQEIINMEAAAGDVYLYSPVDGSVRSVIGKFRDGDIIPAGTELCVINAGDSQCLFGLSSSGTFVYGRKVQVTIGKGDSADTYEGKVISSPEVQPGEYYSNNIYIKLDEHINSRTSDGKAALEYTVLDGVIAVPANAVTVQEGKASVQILDGESVRTRNIVRGPVVGSTVTVLQGLKEGDQVVVSSYNS